MQVDIAQHVDIQFGIKIAQCQVSRLLGKLKLTREKPVTARMAADRRRKLNRERRVSAMNAESILDGSTPNSSIYDGGPSQIYGQNDGNGMGGLMGEPGHPADSLLSNDSITGEDEGLTADDIIMSQALTEDNTMMSTESSYPDHDICEQEEVRGEDPTLQWQRISNDEWNIIQEFRKHKESIPDSQSQRQFRCRSYTDDKGRIFVLSG